MTMKKVILSAVNIIPHIALICFLAGISGQDPVTWYQVMYVFLWVWFSIEAIWIEFIIIDL